MAKPLRTVHSDPTSVHKSGVVPRGAQGAEVMPLTPIVDYVRQVIDSIDTLLEASPRFLEGDGCPPILAEVHRELASLQLVLKSAELTLLRRVVERARVFAERLMSGASPWDHLHELALEELVSVMDMIVDVVELVGTDCACKHEERVSFRMLSRVDPHVLSAVDGMTLRDVRFHQVCGRADRAGAR